MLPQRHFRGERVRRTFRVRRDAHRSRVEQDNETAHCVQRFYHRHWKSNSSSLQPPSLFGASQQHAEKYILRRHTSAIRIQRAWRGHVARNELGSHGFDSAKVLAQQLKRGHERQRIASEDDLALAARKIQALYRGKRIRSSLRKIRRVFAPVSASAITVLVDLCETNRREGVESCVTLCRAQSLEEKRALFDYPVVILDPSAAAPSAGDTVTGVAPFPIQHVVAAIEHNARLRCLVCASGDFQGDRIGSLLSSLKNSRSLQVLALGRIQTGTTFAEERASLSQQHQRQLTPEEDDDGGEGDLAFPSQDIASSQTISQRRLSHQPLHAPKQSPMRPLSQVLRTANFMLEELSMENNTLLRDSSDGSRVAGFLGDFFFARYGRLKKLVLAKMHFPDTNAALLGSALSINTALQSLDLHGNLIGDNGATSIANHGLANNRSLTYLNLAENVIGSPGAKALSECLAHQNRTLETLVLCNNNILNDAIPAFTDAWQLNPTILLIDLRGNLVHSDHLDAVRGAAQERRASSSSESEPRLVLTRKRFSLALSPSASSRVQSPLKRISSSKRGKRLEKVALSPTAFLRQGRQNYATDTRVMAAFIRSPLAVYKQQQLDIRVCAGARVACANGGAKQSRKTKPARYDIKLPAINHHQNAA